MVHVFNDFCFSAFISKITICGPKLMVNCIFVAFKVSWGSVFVNIKNEHVKFKVFKVVCDPNSNSLIKSTFILGNKISFIKIIKLNKLIFLENYTVKNLDDV